MRKDGRITAYLKKASHVNVLIRSIHVHVHVHVQLMRCRNASCTLSDWFTSRPGGCSQPRELYNYPHVHVVALQCSD